MESPIQKRTFNCEQCDKIFRAKTSLKKHIESIHDKIKYDCDQCEFQAKRKEYLHKHMRYVHEGIIDHHCPICSKGFMMSSDVKLHMKVNHEGVKQKCVLCQKEFTSKQAVKNHILAFHEGKTFDCDMCSYKGNSKQNLKFHIQSRHEEALFECDHCDYKGPLLTRYYHMKKHQVDGNWTKLGGKWRNMKKEDIYPTHFCDQCDYLAMTKTQLKRHIKSKHEGKRIKCPKCDKTYSFHGDMMVHFKAEHDKVKFKCQKCEYESNWKGSLRNHIKSFHDMIKYRCNYCEKVYICKFKYKKHVDTHEGGGFKCDHCNYIGSVKFDLVRHQKASHLTCEEDDCGASFSSNFSLNKHKRNVHNVKKRDYPSLDRYPCHLCDFEDITRQGLSEHISDTHQSLIKIKLEQDKNYLK